MQNNGPPPQTIIIIIIINQKSQTNHHPPLPTTIIINRNHPVSQDLSPSEVFPEVFGLETGGTFWFSTRGWSLGGPELFQLRLTPTGVLCSICGENFLEINLLRKGYTRQTKAILKVHHHPHSELHQTLSPFLFIVKKHLHHHMLFNVFIKKPSFLIFYHLL